MTSELARCQQELGALALRLSKAQDDDTIDQGLSVFGPQPDLLLMCAQICNDLAEYEHAVRFASAAIQLTPEDPGAYMKLAWALQPLGPARGKECEDAFQQALDRGAEDIDYLCALKGRAGARMSLGRVAKARDDYERVLVLDNLGRYVEAVDAFERALEESPDYGISIRSSSLPRLRRPTGWTGGVSGNAGVPRRVRAVAPAGASPGGPERPQGRRVCSRGLEGDDVSQTVVAAVDAELESTEASSSERFPRACRRRPEGGRSGCRALRQAPRRYRIVDSVSSTPGAICFGRGGRRRHRTAGLRWVTFANDRPAASQGGRRGNGPEPGGRLGEEEVLAAPTVTI